MLSPSAASGTCVSGTMNKTRCRNMVMWAANRKRNHLDVLLMPTLGQVNSSLTYNSTLTSLGQNDMTTQDVHSVTFTHTRDCVINATVPAAHAAPLTHSPMTMFGPGLSRSSTMRP